MFHHIKTLESKKFSVSFDLRDEGYEQDGTDGQLIPQVSIWDRSRNVYVGRWDVSKKLGNRIYETLKGIAEDADEEAIVSYIARTMDERSASVSVDVPTVDTPSNVCPEMEPDLFRVMKVAGSVRQAYLSDLTQDEAYRWCEENGWELRDHNGFVWDLEVAVQF